MSGNESSTNTNIVVQDEKRCTHDKRSDTRSNYIYRYESSNSECT